MQEAIAWVGARGEGSNQRGSMCKSPEWEPQRGQYGWRECQRESVGVVGDKLGPNHKGLLQAVLKKTFTLQFKKGNQGLLKRG